MTPKPETKAAYIVRAKAALRSDLVGRSWPEKVRAGFRMHAAGLRAKEAMRSTLGVKFSK